MVRGARIEVRAVPHHCRTTPTHSRGDEEKIDSLQLLGDFGHDVNHFFGKAVKKKRLDTFGNSIVKINTHLGN
jgi:hypothetical protein